MTNLKEFCGNGVEQCSEISEDITENSLMSMSTIEELLARYLTDFVIEEDTVLGYINDLETFKEIMEKMKNLGFAYSVRDSDARQKQRGNSKKVFTKGENSNEEGLNDFACPLTVFYQLKAMPIKFFGLPFTIDKTTHYQCAYGCKYYKSRAECSKMKIGNSEPKISKTVRRVGSKKMGCLAKMTIKHITVYPYYKLDVESDWRKKKKLLENLRRDLSDSNKTVEQFQRFYVSVSVQSSHNHPPIKPKFKLPKPKSHKILMKSSRMRKNMKRETPINHSTTTTTTTVTENDWNYVEMASSSEPAEEEPREDLPAKTLNLKDESFFHTLVKFPNTSSTVFQQLEYRTNDLEIEIKPFEAGENASTIEVYEYQPTIQDLQTLFKEKLKSLYTLCSNCSNGSLILKLAGELEQVEIQLSNDIQYSNM